MASKLELEEYLYRRAIDIIESTDTDYDKENLLFDVEMLFFVMG